MNDTEVLILRTRSFTKMLHTIHEHLLNCYLTQDSTSDEKVIAIQFIVLNSPPARFPRAILLKYIFATRKLVVCRKIE